MNMNDVLDLFQFQVFVPYLKVIVVLLVAFLAIDIIKRYTKKALSFTVLPLDLKNMMLRFITYFLWFSVLMYVMVELNLEEILMPLIGASFLVGAAVALAVKDILADAVAGLFLLIDKHFDIGDEIETMNHRGEVINVTLRKTRLKTGPTTVVILPNGKIDSAGWVLYEKRTAKL